MRLLDHEPDAADRDPDAEASRALAMAASAETGERLFPPRRETAT